jgi:uncharacterized GH25 family protein
MEVQTTREEPMSKKWVILLAVICVTGMVSVSQGHMLWLDASNYSPKAGENVTIEIGFGHKYPHTGAFKEENVERIFIRDPKGQELPIERVAPAKYTFSPKTDGQYEVIVKLKQGFVSNTTDGRKMGNKKTLPNAVSCFQFTMNAETLIKVGSKGSSQGSVQGGSQASTQGSSPSQQSDLPLEIVLPESINKLKAGDELLLKVMYQGKPLGGAKISATDKDAALKDPGKWVQESESDEKGIARIKLSSKGPWLIKASHELPYTDKSECDKSTYTITLTLGIE